MLVTKPSTKVAMYVRVSTQQQTTENQLLELYEVCERNDWTVVDEYNETVSGTKGVSERSELHRMLKDASRKKFDKVVVCVNGNLKLTHLPQKTVI
jgi:DNA invertase Pin-like site-specific DNA recombinase